MAINRKNHSTNLILSTFILIFEIIMNSPKLPLTSVTVNISMIIIFMTYNYSIKIIMTMNKTKF